MYLLHPVIDRTETMIHQNLYWPNIRDTVRKEVTNCETCQRRKQSHRKYGKFPSKLAEEIPWNKLCVDVDIIGPYGIRIKGKKEDLHLKDVTIIDPVIGWFEIAQYDDKNRYPSRT